ncbi:MAG: hypothetical protein IT342_01075 [Candidatus Melainabacteria bacterium]|nr:hypothetical protein [Candidatus Melainabacteria bacterium]
MPQKTRPEKTVLKGGATADNKVVQLKLDSPLSVVRKPLFADGLSKAIPMLVGGAPDALRLDDSG